jgi:hypothetical protein
MVTEDEIQEMNEKRRLKSVQLSVEEIQEMNEKRRLKSAHLSVEEIQEMNEKRCQRRSENFQEINEERKLRRGMVTEDKIQEMNEKRCQRRAQLPEDEIQEMNEQRRQRRAQLCVEEIEEMNEKSCQRRAENCQEINEERKQRRAMATEDEIQHINDERRQRRAQLSEDENQHINDERRQRRAQLPEDEIQEMNDERSQKRAQLPEDEILLRRQQEQERLNNRNERSGNVPVRFVPQNNRELRFSYYGTHGFPNRMDNKFSACVSGLFPMGKTDHIIMDAFILDKMKCYDLGTFYPDAHHMDHPVNMCPYCNAYCSRVKNQVCAVAMDVFTYHLCPSILKQHGISTFKIVLMGPSSVIISGQSISHMPWHLSRKRLRGAP